MTKYNGNSYNGKDLCKHIDPSRHIYAPISLHKHILMNLVKTSTNWQQEYSFPKFITSDMRSKARTWLHPTHVSFSNHSP